MKLEKFEEQNQKKKKVVKKFAKKKILFSQFQKSGK